MGKLRDQTGTARNAYVIDVHPPHTAQKEMVTLVEDGLYIKPGPDIPQILGILQVTDLEHIDLVAVHCIEMFPHDLEPGHGTPLTGTVIGGLGRHIVEDHSSAGCHFRDQTTFPAGGPAHQDLVLPFMGRGTLDVCPNGKDHGALQYVLQTVDCFDVVHIRDIEHYQVRQTVREEMVVLDGDVHVSRNIYKARNNRLVRVAVVHNMDPLVLIVDENIIPIGVDLAGFHYGPGRQNSH